MGDLVKNSRYLILILLIFPLSITFAQSKKVTYHVFDQSTNKPIPFVHVQLQGNKTVGTTSDVLGAFTIASPNINDVFIFSHVGYAKREVSSVDLEKNLKIFLLPIVQELEVFEFLAGENPALVYVKGAIQNRNLNDPEKALKSFQFNSYNKVVMSLVGLGENPEVDDADLNILEGGHLFMAETYSEIQFRKPGGKNETIKASKVSGIKNPAFAAVSSAFQPFSLNTEHIKILETPYLSPVSEDGLKKYNYFLEDSIETEWGKSFVVSFEPKPGKSYLLGEGLMHISSNRFALENFLFKNTDPNAEVHFELQQKSVFNGDFWFPSQLNSMYTFIGLDFLERSTTLVNQTFHTEVRTGGEELISKISPIELKLDLDKTPPDWGKLRQDSLSSREYLTYVRFDQMDEKIKNRLNTAANVFAFLGAGRIKLGVVDFIPRRLVRSNRFERFGLGLGLSSNNTLSDLFRVEGYFRYGFGDRAWKYGGHMDLFVHPQNDSRFQLGFSRDIVEQGRSLLTAHRSFSTAGVFFRNFQANRMDHLERYFVEFNQMPIKGFRYRLIGSVENRQNILGFLAEEPSQSYKSDFTSSEVGIDLNYIGNQSTTRIGNDLISINTSYPIVGLSVNKAIPNIFGGNMNFWNSEFKFLHQWHKGNSLNQIHFSAHRIWGSNLPISYLNTGGGIRMPLEGRFDTNISFVGFLQTMHLYEFLSDRSIQINYAHLTGPLLTKKLQKAWISPQFKFHQNFAIGGLEQASYYEFMEFKTMEKGFWESGVELTNLIKYKSGFQKQGFGIGLFYRYGSYALPDTRDNLRLTLTLSTSI